MKSDIGVLEKIINFQWLKTTSHWGTHQWCSRRFGTYRRDLKIRCATRQTPKVMRWWKLSERVNRGQWYHEQRTLVRTAPSEVKKCCSTYVPTEAETPKGKHYFTHQQWHVRKSTNIPDISNSTPALSSLNQASQELFDDVLNQESKWSFDFKNNNKKHGKDDSDDSKIQPHHQAFPETPGVIEASAPQKNR